jgi:hypothetical protein
VWNTLTVFRLLILLLLCGQYKSVIADALCFLKVPSGSQITDSKESLACQQQNDADAVFILNEINSVA